MRSQLRRHVPTKTIVELSCPTPLPAKDTILLGHGSGGKLSAELIRDVFLPAFQNPVLARLDDQAIVNVNGQRLAITTDSFVVKPLFFPGGDIGSLAVHGTVNDLAMGGATPLFLSAAFIIEEGFSMDELRRVVNSLRRAASEAGVQVITGDTKVVEKGKGDGLFINTTGIGLVPDGVDLSADRARPGDKVILSGSIGDHGIAILAQREGLEFETQIQSDSAALHTLVAEMLGVTREIRCMRDPTRGGVSSTLNEIAQQSRGWNRTAGKFPSDPRTSPRRLRVARPRSSLRGERRQVDRNRGTRGCRSGAAGDAASSLRSRGSDHRHSNEKERGARDHENSVRNDSRCGHAGGGPTASHLLVGMHYVSKDSIFSSAIQQASSFSGRFTQSISDSGAIQFTQDCCDRLIQHRFHMLAQAAAGLAGFGGDSHQQ